MYARSIDIIVCYIVSNNYYKCHKQEGSGFIAVSTSKLIVFGSYSSTMNPSVCVEAVERLGKTFEFTMIHSDVCMHDLLFRSVFQRKRKIVYICCPAGVNFPQFDT